jgi:dCMP deaminase
MNDEADLIEAGRRKYKEELANLDKWDRFFLGLAQHTSTASKDPSTKCGAVIAAADRTIISLGYNGFPRKIRDDSRLADRETKYSLVIHAEMNAIMSAARPLHGTTLYVYPMMPCDRCAAHIIQAGIVRVVAPRLTAERKERWGEAVERSRAMFREAQVRFAEIEYGD